MRVTDRGVGRLDGPWRNNGWSNGHLGADTGGNHRGGDFDDVTAIGEIFLDFFDVGIVGEDRNRRALERLKLVDKDFDARDSRRLGEEPLVRGESDLDGQGGGRKTEREEGRGDTGDDRPFGDCESRALPHALALGNGPELGRYGPEDSAREDDKSERQHSDSEDHRNRDTDKSRDSEKSAAIHLGERQDRHHDENCATGRENCAGGASNGGRHRIGPLFGFQKLFPIAGDDEQGIVRSRTEHKDGQNSSDRSVELGSQHVGDLLRNSSGQCIGKTDNDERDDPQNGRTVRHQQEDDDDAGGRGEKRDVGTGKDIRNVLGKAFGSRQIQVYPAESRRCGVFDVVVAFAALVHDIGL